MHIQRAIGRDRRGNQAKGWWGVSAVVGLLAAATSAAPISAPTCQAAYPGGPLFITDSCSDPVLNQPYIDVDRPGTTTDPATGVTVGYRYVHGGFTGTNGRFSFYFPSSHQYLGRFFESTYPTVSMEGAAPDEIAFAISHGAYVVSSNNAGGVPAGGALAPYRANAAAAKFSRVVAEQMYRTSARPRGYISGASGGAYQTIGSLENTTGVWDGGVPMVPGVPNSIPSFQTIQVLALRVLGDKLPQIADAMAPGGSGNPYAGLTAEQQAVLREATRLGFPLRGWWQYATLNGGAFSVVQFAVRAIDPTYRDAFWTMSGYEGSDPEVQAARIQFGTTVVGLVGANGLVLASMPAGDLNGADLVVTGGPAAGQSIPISAVTGNTVQVLFNPGITAGTPVRLDNSWLIALQYYQRHQVPTPDEYAWNQYRGPNGDPLYAQRPILVGPILDASTAGSVSSGHFNGKIIMLASTMDVQAFPWSADWYGTQAQAALGSSFGDSYRLWYMDNADHGPEGPAATSAANAAAHIVPYTGEFQQALLDLDAWVAHGVPAPASTKYSIGANTEVQLPVTAEQRHGVQPVVTLSAIASEHAPTGEDVEHSATGEHGEHAPPVARVDIAVGQSVTFSMKAEVPPGTGKIVRVEWDFQGTGNFPVSMPFTHARHEVNLHQTFTFTQSGTYFPVVRVTSQRDGSQREVDASAPDGESGTSPYALIQNLAALRVVVH